MNERMSTKVVGMHLGEGFELSPQLLEAEIVRQKKSGGKWERSLSFNLKLNLR